MKSTFFHVSLIVIGLVLIVFAIINFTTLQTLSRQIAEFEPVAQESIEENVVVEETDEELIEEEFASLLSVKQGYDLPFGAAEIEGYRTTMKRRTSLDNSTPMITCSVFVVTDGPELLMETLEDELYGTPPAAIMGIESSSFGEAINNSTKKNPVRVLATLDTIFEGELIGCMPGPFSSIIEIE